MVECCFVFIVLNLSAHAQERKWQYRIGLDAFVSSLVNVDKVPLGYVERKDYGALMPHVQAGRKLNENWTIAAGLGFMRHRSTFRFDSPEITSRGIWYDYLAIPVGA